MVNRRCLPFSNGRVSDEVQNPPLLTNKGGLEWGGVRPPNDGSKEVRFAGFYVEANVALAIEGVAPYQRLSFSCILQFFKSPYMIHLL